MVNLTKITNEKDYQSVKMLLEALMGLEPEMRDYFQDLIDETTINVRNWESTNENTTKTIPPKSQIEISGYQLKEMIGNVLSKQLNEKIDIVDIFIPVTKESLLNTTIIVKIKGFKEK